MSNPATLKPPNPNFGAEMKALREERGSWKGGPKPRATRYKDVIRSVEDRIAEGLTDVFDDYIKELKAFDPEECSVHKKVLECPDCGATSQRTRYNHNAAQYLMDRLAGRPTSRSESAVTVKFHEQLAVVYLEAFRAINELPDPDERTAAFIEHMEVIDAQYGESPD